MKKSKTQYLLKPLYLTSLGTSFSKAQLEPISMSVLSSNQNGQSRMNVLGGGNITLPLNNSTALGRSMAANLTSLVILFIL